MDDNKNQTQTDSLMIAMAEHASPQTVKHLFSYIMDDVVERDCQNGWFDLIGLVRNEPFLVIRYQWWPIGWRYRMLTPTEAEVER